MRCRLKEMLFQGLGSADMSYKQGARWFKKLLDICDVDIKKVLHAMRVAGSQFLQSLG